MSCLVNLRAHHGKTVSLQAPGAELDEAPTLGDSGSTTDKDCSDGPRYLRSATGDDGSWDDEHREQDHAQKHGGAAQICA